MKGVRRASRGLRAALVGPAVVVAACSGGTVGTVPAESLPPGFTYVAVGASETMGVGAENPVMDAWPSVFYRSALPRSATYVNVGVSGASVREALERELPLALAEEPRLVTVWLNVNDLLRQVPVDRYEEDLRALVRGLRRGGATDVLVGSTPPLTDLPVVKACLPGGSGCRLPGGNVAEELITERIAAYDAAVARVAENEGAVLVDLGTEGRIDPTHVSSDGFHPSTEGHRRVASAFAEALASSAFAADLSPPTGSTGP